MKDSWFIVIWFNRQKALSQRVPFSMPSIQEWFLRSFETKGLDLISFQLHVIFDLKH